VLLRDGAPGEPVTDEDESEHEYESTVRECPDDNEVEATG
jgi:hypothetical protein